MKKSKFVIGDLVTYNSEIHEIVQVIETEAGFEYELILRAFIREMEVSEWNNQIIPHKSTKTESELSQFEYSRPKFNLGERVRSRDNNCVVRFIQFENYHYEYHVMNETHDGSISHGWMVEEGYLSK